METQLNIIEGFVQDVLSEYEDLFLVHLKIKPTNNFKIYIDGDNGVTIEKCVHINRKLYKLIEEKEMFPTGDFSLEVSSPGVDEPLKLYRQYKKNIGRNIEVVFNDESIKEGKLLEATETDIIIEVVDGKGKKAITQQVLIPLSNVKKAVVQISFNN